MESLFKTEVLITTKNNNMKKILTISLLACFTIGAFSQNSDQKWSLGLFGGKTV